MDIDVKKLIPKLMDTEFWNDLCDTISDELTLVKEQVERKRNFYSISHQRDAIMRCSVFGKEKSSIAELDIINYSQYNTDNGTLYWSLVTSSGNHLLLFFKDYAKKELVLKSQAWSGNDPTSLTLTEVNSSGLSGSAVVTFVRDSLGFTNYIQLPSSDFETMLNIGRMFGFNPDISINSDPTYVEKLIYSIPFFVKNKAQYKNYYTIFRLARFDGDIFNIYWNGNKLIRAMARYIDSLEDKRINNLLSSGQYINGQKNYDLFVEGDQYLDNSPPILLDDDDAWYLDQSFSRLTSKHLGVEYFIGSYIDVNPANPYRLIDKYEIIGEGTGLKTNYSYVVTNLPYLPLSDLMAIYLNDVKMTNLSVGSPNGLGECIITAEGLETSYYNNKSGLLQLNFSTAPLLGVKIKVSYLHSMTKEYIGFLNSMTTYNKKAVEVPHVGSQISFIMDKNGFRDIFVPGSDYTVNETKTSQAVTSRFIEGFSPFGNIGGIALGNGNLVVPKTSDGVKITSNSLANEVYFASVDSNEIAVFGEEKWYMISSVANANRIREVLNPGETDGTKTSFSGTLKHTPIQEKSVRFKFIQNSAEKVVTDQYRDCVGYYNYFTSLTKSETNTAAIDRVASISYTLTKENIVPSTIRLLFTIGGTTYNVLDSTVDGVNGSFTTDASNEGTKFIQVGTINYQKRKIDIVFTTPTDALSKVQFSYSYEEKDTYNLDEQAYAEINYKTGTYTLYTKHDRRVKDEIISTTSMVEIDGYHIGLGTNEVLKPGSLKLHYFLPDGSEYYAQDIVDSDNPNVGYFENAINLKVDQLTGRTVSSIDYVNNFISVEFNNNTSYLNSVTLSYTYTILNPPDLNTNISVEYTTSQNIKVTEAGLFDTGGNMIAYATFPPIELNDPKFHTSYQFFIYNGDL